MSNPAAGTLGPVELMVVSLAQPAPSPEVIGALVAQVEAGVVRVLDFVVVTKSVAGDVEVTEVEFDALGATALDLAVPGLTGDEDIEVLAETLEPGATAAIVALELVWARELGARLAAEGSEVVASERIPSVVVNEIAALAD
ncbi:MULTISPECIES: DUF6325 family protein [unclassified Gordonia (in: high G+C Gram-positive bacteria)]|uniref:DUF6325 family protein n=1 Tax=unclassified Gordonia (in: high G+C Gram-positive bacteria) TaxID=2657482 RepID=UPI002000021F|nr:MULTISPECIES: DUF6325 family protein [unclassified Gordonia (in: high G+C Gram-positive bacteria)]UQE75464.1 DUF6325 family protein [Gordonia sp. PP30]